MMVSSLRSWILDGGGRNRTSLPDVDPALVFDNGISCVGTDAISHLVLHEPFTNVRLITEVISESCVCIVAEGTDPVTGLRHRQAWVFELAEDKISRIVLTSAHIPDKPYDGSLPLRPDSG